MSTATFTEQGHKYEVDGIKIPSVTQVLSLVGVSDVSGIPPHILERASAIGTAVHRATEFLDQDDLDLSTIEETIVGYVAAYQKFKEETGFIPHPAMIEYRTVGESCGFRFGMCVDRVGEFPEGSKLAGSVVILDIKTSSRAQASWELQTAAYRCGLGFTADSCRRMVVHLHKDGTYHLLPHLDPSDDLSWASALILAHWRIAKGVKIK